ncbi:T7SS effector LXG polymorphic toxin [Listeria newyorkensis]|uniref:T7SS effector LXG polymorphic toxin n=1 Tax=Listeria newyorkensis TaxID=1497681 RepID=UPI0010F481A9|nr:T7SS effector LXG polymorphic toxin [Listeria newyorkensis]
MARIDIAEIHNFVTVFIAESKRVQMELDHKKTAIGHFLSDSDIQGNIGDQAKAYYRDIYYPLLDGTKTSLIDAEECLKKYISDFHAQVDPSANAKLDLARMYELQADMRKYENKIENLKANVNSTANSMASIGKNIGLQLGMETALGNFEEKNKY